MSRGWGSHRLHCDDGPSIVWGDGWGIWSIHGVRVPQQVVEAPETLTGEQIASEPNVEVRRVMLERFGAERFLRERKAARRHEDETGTLWTIDIPGDEPLVMVEVVNSTPERDGSSKTYMLRVPPDIATARAAVAWTFGIDRPADYAVLVES